MKLAIAFLSIAVIFIFLSCFSDFPLSNSAILLISNLAVFNNISSTSQQSSDYKYCYNPSTNSIVFMHLTNQSDRWKPLETCAFRQAARLNRPTGVCVLIASDMRPHPSFIGLSNLEFARLDVEKITNGTSVYDYYAKIYSNKKMTGQYAMYDLTDGLRYAYLYKYGGYYLDTDVITLRNFTHLRNTMATEYGQTLIGTGILFFDRLHPLLRAVLDEFLSQLRTGTWGSVGPSLLTNVHRSGRVSNKTYRLVSTELNPSSYLQSYAPFSKPTRELMENRTRNSFTLHLYRKAVYHQGVGKFWDDGVRLPNGSFVEEICGDI